jgi:hypothetical protein
MQMKLHDVVVNETPQFLCLKASDLSHSIGVRGENLDDIFVIPLDLHVVVSFYPTFKPSQEEFETCERYELMYETLQYDPSAKTFDEQEAGMTDSWGNLKVPGEFHPKRRQFFSLHQKEDEIKLLGAIYSDTSAKLQDLSPALGDGTLLAESDCVTTTTDCNVSLVKS